MPGIRPRALCVLYQEHKRSVANTLLSLQPHSTALFEKGKENI